MFLAVLERNLLSVGERWGECCCQWWKSRKNAAASGGWWLGWAIMLPVGERKQCCCQWGKCKKGVNAAASGEVGTILLPVGEK